MNTNKRVLSLICLLFTLTMLQNTVCLDMDNLFKSEELDLIIEKFNEDDLNSSKEVKRLYDDYLKVFGKNYNSIDELKFRKQVFKANTKEIIEFNKCGSSAKLGVTPFMDWSFAEFENFYLMKESDFEYIFENAKRKRDKKLKRIMKFFNSSNERRLQFGRFDDFGEGGVDLFGRDHSRHVRLNKYKSSWNEPLDDRMSWPKITIRAKKKQVRSVNRRNAKKKMKPKKKQRLKIKLRQKKCTKKKKVKRKNKRKLNRKHKRTNRQRKNKKTKCKKKKKKRRRKINMRKYKSKVFNDVMIASETINKKKYDISKFKKRMNWAAARKVSPIRNQLKCASCYAFSGIGALESFGLIHYKQKIDLSEQEVMDCSKKYENVGCTGGLPSNVMDYIKDTGIQAESRYKYRGKNQRCQKRQLRKGRMKFKMMDYAYVDTNVLAIIQALQYGPVAVVHFVGKKHFKYKRGIVDEHFCNIKKKTPNHSSLIIGYNLKAKIPYFIIKNSWGVSWGEKGYFRMKIGPLTTKNKGLCGIAKYDVNISLVKVKEHI